jgi:hypothetical protein
MTNRHRALAASLSGLVASIALLTGVLATSAMGCGSSQGETVLLNVDPRAGATLGEQPVKLLGQNFRTDIGYTVYFGTKRAGSVTILNPETLLAMTPQVDDPGPVDITIRADNGPAWRITKAFRYENMGGSVVEGLGEHAGPSSAKKQNY